MQKIKLTSDSPGYLKVWDIEEDLLDFTNTLDEKFDSVDFVFWFCFRALKDDALASGWKSKVTFYKKDNALSFDVIMPETEFTPYKKDIEAQKKIMGKYFFPFFENTIIKYANKLATLKPLADDLIKDMRLFLMAKKWL